MTAISQVAIGAVQYYLGLPQPISLNAACGIVSVLYAGESGLKTGSQGAQSTETPGALNPSGAYGIASWNGPRQAALASFARQYGLNVGDLNTQLHFVLTECANSYPAVWAAIKDPSSTLEQIVSVFVEQYERPANPAAESSRSLAFAQELVGANILPPAPAPVVAPPPLSAPVPTPAPVASEPSLPTAFVIALMQLMEQYNITAKQG